MYRMRYISSPNPAIYYEGLRGCFILWRSVGP